MDIIPVIKRFQSLKKFHTSNNTKSYNRLKKLKKNLRVLWSYLIYYVYEYVTERISVKYLYNVKRIELWLSIDNE